MPWSVVQIARLTLSSGKEYITRVDFGFVIIRKELRAITIPWKINSEVRMQYLNLVLPPIDSPRGRSPP
jgi:hypothetical protein